MENQRRASKRWLDMGGIHSEAFVRKGRARLIEGGTQRSRAAALVADVRGALRGGARADEVLVLCADPSSASRLHSALTAESLGVRVQTCRELACSVVESAEAGRALGLEFTGGRARILAAYEADFVVEDVKTLGTRPKRLREMLKFLYRGWTELLDEDPEWLITVEEIATLDFLGDELLYLGAVMEPQLSNLATKALRLDSSLRARFARSQVFVEGYQNLSRASQLLCQLVADKRLVVATDARSNTEVYESYPCLEGVGDFTRLNPDVQVVDLDVVGAQVAGGIYAVGEAAPERVRSAWSTPAEEVAALVEAVAGDIAGGCDPQHTAVITFHPWWTQQVARALEDRGVGTNAWMGPARLRADVRDLERCLGVRVLTLLRLLADPRDGVAWRSWFGFGDYLTRSNVFCEMRNKVGVAAGDTGSGNVRRDLEAYGYDLDGDLKPLFAEVRGLRGTRLLGYLVQTLAGPDTPPPALLRPLAALGPDADAAQMVAELDRLQFFCGIPARPGVVVGPYEGLAGLDFESASFAGFVNGLFPKAAYFDLTKVSINKQKKMGEHDGCQAHAMARMGSRVVRASAFERCDRTFAERVGAKQERIFAANDGGREMSEVSPSIYMDVLMGRR